MSAQQWLVTYKNRQKETGSVIIDWPEILTAEYAAIRIREYLLGQNYVLVDTPRGHPEPTVFLLKYYGYQIVSIEKVEQENLDGQSPVA